MTHDLSLSLNPNLAMKLSAGFAADMQMGQTCGAIAGSIMVLGLANGTEECTKKEGRIKASASVKNFPE